MYALLMTMNFDNTEESNIYSENDQWFVQKGQFSWTHALQGHDFSYQEMITLNFNVNVLFYN